MHTLLPQTARVRGPLAAQDLPPRLQQYFASGLDIPRVGRLGAKQVRAPHRTCGGRPVLVIGPAAVACSHCSSASCALLKGALHKPPSRVRGWLQRTTAPPLESSGASGLVPPHATAVLIPPPLRGSASSSRRQVGGERGCRVSVACACLATLHLATQRLATQPAAVAEL